MMSTNLDRMDAESTILHHQYHEIATCHEAAMALNNFAVLTLLVRDRNYLAASMTFRDVIYMIKKCIIHELENDDDDDDDDDDDLTTTTSRMNMMTSAEIHNLLHNGYQRASTSTSTSTQSSQPQHPSTDDWSFINRTTNNIDSTNRTTMSTTSTSSLSEIHIQVISNGAPCTNRPPVGVTPPTPSVRSIIMPHNIDDSNGHNTRTKRNTDDMSIPTTSTHSVVSSSSSEGTTTTAAAAAAAVSDAFASTGRHESRQLPSPLTLLESLVAPRNFDVDSSDNNNNYHTSTVPLSVFPMTIDDYNPRATIFYTEDTMTLQQQQVEYHAAIILYNFGIVHQCLGMMDDTTLRHQQMMEQQIHPNNNDTTTTTDHHHHPQQNDDDGSFARLQVSYTMFSNTLSWIHQLVEPVIDLVMNADQFEEYNSHDHPTATAGNDITVTSNRTTTIPVDYRYFHMSKYLQVMILINYHIAHIVDEIQLPSECYEYHCTMINEIHNLISYLEIFHPMTDIDNDGSNSHQIHGNRHGASPAA